MKTGSRPAGSRPAIDRPAIAGPRSGVRTCPAPMFDRYPYGKAPFALLLIAIVSVCVRVATARHSEGRPDLTIVTHTEQHFESYRRAIPQFEREHGVKVQLQ